VNNTGYENTVAAAVIAAATATAALWCGAALAVVLTSGEVLECKDTWSQLFGSRYPNRVSIARVV
jgi:hypothetical protein